MLNQPPQWEQNVNRGSEIVDPVVTIEELSRLKPLRTTRIDYALVFTSAQGRLDTYLPPTRPSRKELVTRRWTSVYTVDIGLHEAHAVLVLPSSNDAFPFEVALGCTWRVADPAAFVASGERDVPAMVKRLVDGIVRRVLRTYAMEDSHLAEKEAQDALAAYGPLGVDVGLHVRCGIQVRRDAATLEHARELREIEFTRQKLEPQHSLTMREDELAADRAMTQARQRHAIELETQQLDHVRETERRRQELELQALEAQKIDYYTYYLERGGPRAMAFQLAQHPEDARLIMENLRQDQLLTMQNQLQVALQALGAGDGGLEEHQMDEPRRLAANIIREVLSNRLTHSAPADTPALDGGPQVPHVPKGTADGQVLSAAAPEPGEAGVDANPASPPAPDSAADSDGDFGYRRPPFSPPHP